MCREPPTGSVNGKEGTGGLALAASPPVPGLLAPRRSGEGAATERRVPQAARAPRNRGESEAQPTRRRNEAAERPAASGAGGKARADGRGRAPRGAESENAHGGKCAECGLHPAQVAPPGQGTRAAPQATHSSAR